MITLLDALQTRFTVASLDSTITGGLHAGLAPERTAQPYAYHNGIGADYLQPYGTTAQNEVVRLQFNVVGVGFRAVGALCESLATAYRDQVLAISGGTMVHVHQDSPCEHDPEPIDQDEQGRDVWRWYVAFTFATQ